MKHDLSYWKVTKYMIFNIWTFIEENYDLKHIKITISWVKCCVLNEQKIQMSTTTFYKKVWKTCYLYYQINLVIWADQELRYW